MENTLSQYWMNEPHIREARHIFFQKGVIRRELIEDELAFSWLRCKYKGTSFVEITSSNSENSRRIPIKQMKKMPVALNELWIGLFDLNNELVCFTGNLWLGQTFSKCSFIEASAGFNGIGTCIETRKMAMTVGLEHYNEQLCPYVTLGIPYEHQMIGVILPLQIADDETVGRIINLPFASIFQNQLASEKDLEYDCYFFRRDIHVYESCYKQFLKYASQYAYLSIGAKNKSDGYLLAQEIHKKSSRTSGEFVYLCVNDLEKCMTLSMWHSGFVGTIYIEDLCWFPRAFQRKLDELIEKKLTNCKVQMGLKDCSLGFVIFNNKMSENSKESPELYSALQKKFEKVNLVIPSYLEIGQQFKSYLYTEFEKICSKLGYREMNLSEDALNVLTGYQWPEQYTELVYLTDYVAHQKFKGNEVPLSALPEYIIKSRERFGGSMQLKAMEHQWIVSVLGSTHGNIKKTSELLGITRTTLYKKIEEYQIKV
jgi:hypothetical protein